MLRLTVCCLLLCAGMAKPPDNTADASAKRNDHGAFTTPDIHSAQTDRELAPSVGQAEGEAVTSLRSGRTRLLVGTHKLAPGSRSVFYSPGYPNNYRNRRDMYDEGKMWQLQTASHSQTRLNITCKYQFPPESDQSGEVGDFLYVGAQSMPVYRYYFGTGSIELQDESWITVCFLYDYQRTDKGFKCKVDAY